MQEIVLLFVFFKVNLKFCVLLFLLESDYLAYDVLKYLFEGNCILPLVCDFDKHVLQPDHVEGYFLKRKLHYTNHNHNEMLNSTLLIWQFVNFRLHLP